jgi:hypothetical protein
MTEHLMKHFPNFTLFPRPVRTVEPMLTPNWISGFVAGDGHFGVSVRVENNVIVKIGYTMDITQHSRDLDLMNKIISF